MFSPALNHRHVNEAMYRRTIQVNLNYFAITPKPIKKILLLDNLVLTAVFLEQCVQFQVKL